MSAIRSEADSSRNGNVSGNASTLAQQQIADGFNTGSYDKGTWAALDKLPYPGAAPGTPQDQANQQANIAAQSKYQSYEAALQEARNSHTFIDQVAPAIAIGLATAGVGSAVGAGVGSAIGGTTGSVVGGAVGGATTAGLAAAVQGQNPIKAGGIGFLTGGLGAGIGALGNAEGINPNVTSAAGKLATHEVGSAISGALAPSNNSNVYNGINAGIGAVGAAGSIANGGTNNMAVNSGNVGSGLGIGNSLLGAAGNILGTAGGMQQANANGNVLSLANAGTGVGTNTSFAGPNSTATINKGQVTTGLSGGLGAANTAAGNFAAQQGGIAQSFGGVAPANIQNAINSQSQQRAPTGTQGVLGGQLGLQGAVQGSQFGLIGAGQNQLNNPLTGNLQQAAQTQLGTAGSDFTNTYNTTLAGLNRQLALPTAQAESQLADAQFGRGQLGTSGGALQTQAFATGLGQAYMGNQQTAFNEAMGAQNSATANAATLNNSANNNLSTANGLLANAYGQFNNTSQLNANTANSIFNQNSTISQLGNQYGQQNLNNQITADAVPAQLAGAYQQNANAGIAGATGLNNIDLSGFQAALGAGTQQGNQYNNAINNASRVVASGQQTNGLSFLGNALGNPSTSSSLSGIASGIGGLFSGNGSNANGFGATNGGFSTNGDVSSGLDSSGIPNDLAWGGGYSTPDMSNLSNIFGS